MELKQVRARESEGRFIIDCPYCSNRQIARAGFPWYQHECDALDETLFIVNGHILRGLPGYIFEEQAQAKQKPL